MILVFCVCLCGCVCYWQWTGCIFGPLATEYRMASALHVCTEGVDIYIIVISRAQGMHGIYCTKARERDPVGLAS